jgi:hypothetical protein
VPSHDTSSRGASQVLTHWIEDCVQSHVSCPAVMVSSLPKRILELTPTQFFLQEHLSIKARYACLSHCWGSKGPALKLTKDTMANLQQGVEIGELPKTFQDAVQVCLSLGIRFLWIDSLCESSVTICQCVTNSCEVSYKAIVLIGKRLPPQWLISMKTPI